MILRPSDAIHQVDTFSLPTEAMAAFCTSSVMEGSRWVAASDQVEKNRLVKDVLLEKEGHYANSNTRFE